MDVYTIINLLVFHVPPISFVVAVVVLAATETVFVKKGHASDK